jgi:hypothetical protein
MKRYDEFLLRVQKTINEAKDTLEGILEADDDLILAATTVCDEGGTMQETILDLARARVEQARKEVQTTFETKQKLEKKAADLLDASSKAEGTFMARYTGRVGEFFNFSTTRVEAPEVMTDEIAAWARKNAPGALPKPQAPELTIDQQAKIAHVDHCEACYKFTAAKGDLARLERKVAKMAEIMACVEVA